MMSGILSPGQEVRTSSSAIPCRVERLLGAGGQGEVYQASVQGSALALKWYYAHTATEAQRATLRALIDAGAPDARFLWPVELVTRPSTPGFGYLMALREPRYKGIADLLVRRVTPSFRSLATAGAHLAEGFLQLHAKGLCYRDISHGNVFFDPDSGDVLICDNDNVGLDRKPAGILGTPRFMAPEVVRGEALPSTQTDLFSLAVLLFLILVNHHPLEGRKEADIHCFDLPAMTRLYGTEPVFIFDPADPSNKPIPGYHDNALAFWPIYPAFLKNLFTRSFTEGIRDPDQGRIRESTWRTAMSRLRDSILYCGCGAENFYDTDSFQAAGGTPGPCWKCRRPLQLPPRIRIGKAVVMLNHDSKLFRHHLEESAPVDFTTPLAEVTRHPADPTLWGLKNLTSGRWTATASDGTVRDVEPAKSLPLAVGTRVHFGNTEGQIRL
jgi:DNA-binding helix-hairpin-helix protein with protein kinase domain